MAHEAFALSPISAFAAHPGEGDYEAISEAFMETARGRWFLGEYAKRNRNSDTRMVLNAVARLEQTLQAIQQPPTDSRLLEILAGLANVVEQAAAVAVSAVDGLALAQRLAPIRDGAKILTEISWRWREIGTELRSCDAIDAQVGAIEQSCDQLAGNELRAALTAAFALIKTQIEGLAADAGAPRADAGQDARSSDARSSKGEASAAPGGEASRRSDGPDIDPLSAIRDMSLTDKLAFFS
jgi:hypothetical protein